MITGDMLTAPEGYHSLSAGITYYFLSNDAGLNRARLMEFSDEGKELKAFLITLTTIDFEEGLESGLIKEMDSANRFPPWLASIQGVSVSDLERRRVSSKETYDQKVNRRFMAIADLVQRSREILGSDNPDAIINAYAKAHKPKQNAARLRLWFYTYLTFGRNKWALIPPLHRIGGWNREQHGQKRKLGRPASNGRNSGYRCDAEMKEKIQAGFVKYKSAYKTADALYRDILTKKFGCVATEKNGNFMFRHKDGLPFPSKCQVRYWIEKLFSSKIRLKAVRGKYKARSLMADAGSFSERLINVNQSVEFDGYYISEKLTGLTEGSAVDSFCVVRATCALSGAIVGIGFSEGRENMEAYLMCLFSMAVDKVAYCELFGLAIRSDQWPCIGLSGGIVFDRGPGAYLEIEQKINWLGTFETTPVFSGQSKPSVESSHPRNKKVLGRPTYFQSKLNFVEMVRREILQVLFDNATSDASARMEDSMYMAGVKPTPLGIWNYWSGRGRNSSIGMAFESAVREFLSDYEADVRQNAVYFHSRKFRSAELEATGIFDRVAMNGKITVKVYVLKMCVRHIWIILNGILHQLDMVRTQRTVDGDCDISLRDLKEIEQARRESVKELKNERSAAQQYFRNWFNSETNAEWDAGERKIGRVPKSGAAQRDTEDYNRFRGKEK